MERTAEKAQSLLETLETQVKLLDDYLDHIDDTVGEVVAHARLLVASILTDLSPNRIWEIGEDDE